MNFKAGARKMAQGALAASAAGRGLSMPESSTATATVSTFTPACYREAVPALFSAQEDTARRAFEFVAVTIRNAHTRRAYGRAASDFSA